MKNNYVVLKEEMIDDVFTHIQINTPLGVFDGCTSADEIDAKYPSKYQGYEIALGKALRKYAEAAARILRHEVKTLEDIVHAMYSAPHSKEGYHERAVVRGVLKQKKGELAKWQEKIDGISNSIKLRVQSRDRIVKHYEEKDKNN